MSDPNYYHEFDPNRAGRCKTIVNGNMCHQTATAQVHQWPAHWDKPASIVNEQQAVLEAAREMRDAGDVYVELMRATVLSALEEAKWNELRTTIARFDAAWEKAGMK